MRAVSTLNWVRWWFRGAALYGTAALLALLLRPAPGDAALFYYGFAGTALAFQLVFWIIGGDPGRYRALMVAAVIEKLAFVLPVAVLAAGGHAAGGTIAAGLIDLALGIGFVAAWLATPAA